MLGEDDVRARGVIRSPRPPIAGGKVMTTRTLSRGAVLFVALALMGASLMPAPASASTAPGDCPEILPTSQVTKGMMGTGYTVSQGTDPEPFSAEVLGILTNGIGPGRDLIIIDAHNAAIDKAGGIWAGMSGSPVYDENGRLMGAVSYGLAYGPSTIAGVTPAEDMVQIMDYPDGSPQAGAQSVALSSGMTAKVSAATGYSSSQSDSMRRLRTPLSVSGASGRGLRKLGHAVARAKLPFIPYAGSSASSTAGIDPNPLVPGSSFAGTLSYGDVTLAGIGTTTYICNGKALAFGHPFLDAGGPTVFGANSADTIAIIDDQFGPYKLANVGGTVGRGDQDRFAGIRAILGDSPPVIPITTSVTAPTRSRSGESDAVTSEYVPYVSFIHLISNFDVTRDRIGGGDSELSWRIAGTDAAGNPWQLRRSDVYSSTRDVSYESLLEVENEIYAIYSNRFENVKFTSIHVNASFDDDPQYYTFQRVRFSADGTHFQRPKNFEIRPGETITVRVTLKENDSESTRDVTLKLQVPQTVGRNQIVELTGGAGRSRGGFGFLGGCYRCGRDPNIASFQDLLDSFRDAPHNDELTATLLSSRGKVLWDDKEVLDRVVNGQRVWFFGSSPKGGSSGSSGSGAPTP
jgi:hypothetical protein